MAKVQMLTKGWELAKRGWAALGHFFTALSLWNWLPPSLTGAAAGSVAVLGNAALHWVILATLIGTLVVYGAVTLVQFVRDPSKKPNLWHIVLCIAFAFVGPIVARYFPPLPSAVPASAAVAPEASVSSSGDESIAVGGGSDIANTGDGADIKKNDCENTNTGTNTGFIGCVIEDADPPPELKEVSRSVVPMDDGRFAYGLVYDLISDDTVPALKIYAHNVTAEVVYFGGEMPALQTYSARGLTDEGYEYASYHQLPAGRYRVTIYSDDSSDEITAVLTQ